MQFLRAFDPRDQPHDRDFYDISSAEEDNADININSRSSRSASLGSASSAAAESLGLSSSPLRPTMGSPHTMSSHSHSMFDPTTVVEREAPPKPDPQGVDYARAASWASGTCANVLADEKGRQLFRCFLFESLAEENLSFLEAMEKLKRMKNNDDRKTFAREIIQQYSPYVNLSSGSMKRIKDAADSDNPDPDDFAPALKEIRRLLENDQFPRFRRSDIYLEFLEQLLPRATADKWNTSFEALLGNHVGRHHFRIFLRGIHAEENLRFWEAVVEFRSAKTKNNTATKNLAKVILNTYLAEGTTNEVFLPFGVRQMIERRIEDNEIDINLFDEAIKHVEQVLRNDPYVRFLQSSQYLNLLARLKK